MEQDGIRDDATASFQVDEVLSSNISVLDTKGDGDSDPDTPRLRGMNEYSDNECTAIGLNFFYHNSANVSQLSGDRTQTSTDRWYVDGKTNKKLQIRNN